MTKDHLTITAEPRLKLECDEVLAMLSFSKTPVVGNCERGIKRHLNSRQRSKSQIPFKWTTSPRKNVERNTIHLANFVCVRHMMNAEMNADGAVMRIKEREVLRETVSEMNADTEPCWQSKVLQRHRWQRQSSWTLFEKFLV